MVTEPTKEQTFLLMRALSKTRFESQFLFDTLVAMNGFNKIFFRGLLTLMPVAITIYVVYKSVIILDSVLGSLLRALLPEQFYFPGMGFVITLFLIYCFGLLLNNFVTKKIFTLLEKSLTEVPFIKAIYSPLKDLMNLFSKTGHNNLGSVVLVQMGDSGAQALGLVTRDHFQDLKLSEVTEGKIAVYFPLSYGLGGFTFLVPRNRVTEINMPVEKAMSLAITGWVKAEEKNETKQ
jgi:uncharacterized membrane protein